MPPSLKRGVSSHDLPCAAVTPKRKRAISERDVDRGLDRLVDNSEDTTLKYINETLESKSPEVADLIAKWLRDGDVERALARKKAQSMDAVLGPVIPERKQGFRLKHFKRRFLRVFVDMCAKTTLVPGYEASRKKSSRARSTCTSFATPLA